MLTLKFLCFHKKCSKKVSKERVNNVFEEVCLPNNLQSYRKKSANSLIKDSWIQTLNSSMSTYAEMLPKRSILNKKEEKVSIWTCQGLVKDRLIEISLFCWSPC